jgi:hypothetical protein
MDEQVQPPNSLPTVGIVLIAFGIGAGLAAPFATNGREFAMSFASAAAFAFATWIGVRLIGYFSNPHRRRPTDAP